jgi:hypothetical protein
MSQFQTTGGGTIDSGDRRIERKVVISTQGNPQAPGGTGVLSNVAITEEAGGIKRGVFEYTRGGGGDASYNAYGKRIELMGGSREVPIYNHPLFKSLTATQISTVQEEAQKPPADRAESISGVAENNLYQLLIRQIEYYVAPSLVARISEIESGIPSVSGLCKVNDPRGVGSPGSGTWILTGISAAPLGDRYEVTREYTYIEQPEVANFLYSNG